MSEVENALERNMRHYYITGCAFSAMDLSVIKNYIKDTRQFHDIGLKAVARC